MTKSRFHRVLVVIKPNFFEFYVEATEHIESDFEFREKIIKFVVKIIIFPSFIKHLFSKSLHLSLNVQANNTSSDSTYQFS